MESISDMDRVGSSLHRKRNKLKKEEEGKFETFCYHAIVIDDYRDSIKNADTLIGKVNKLKTAYPIRGQA